MSRRKRNCDDDSTDTLQSEETDNSSSTKRPRSSHPSAMMARKANEMVQATTTSWAKEAQQGQDAEMEPPDVDMLYAGDQQEPPHSAGKEPYDLGSPGDRIRKYCDDMTAAELLGSDREALIAGGPHGHPELMDQLYAETEKNAKVILWQNMLEHWEYTYMRRSMDDNGQDTSSYHDIPMDLAPKDPSGNEQRTESGTLNPLRIRRKAGSQIFRIPSASLHGSEGEATQKVISLNSSPLSEEYTPGDHIQ